MSFNENITCWEELRLLFATLSIALEYGFTFRSYFSLVRSPDQNIPWETLKFRTSLFMLEDCAKYNTKLGRLQPWSFQGKVELLLIRRQVKLTLNYGPRCANL